MLQRRRAEQLLSDGLDLDVVHTCSTIGRFMSWLRVTYRSVWPHLLVLGLLDPPEKAEDTAALRALRNAGVRVLVLSTWSARAGSRRLYSTSVDGVVSAADSENAFVSAAGTVLSGGTIITSRAQEVIARPADAPRLSVQEERVLGLYASGRTIAQAAEEMGVRDDTARKYLSRVKTKYAAAGRPVRTKLELAQIAWSDGYSRAANE